MAETDAQASEAGPDAVGKMIHQAKQQLEHMIDSNPQVMLLVDRKRTIVRANRALISLLGTSGFEHVLNKSLSDIFECEDATFFEQLVTEETGYRVCEAKADLPDRPGRMLRFTVIGSGKGTDLYALMIHDTTEESEKAKKQERQHKKEAIQTLMGALMHTINQPLTVIMMRIQLMLLALKQETVDTAEFSRSLQDIMRLTMEIADTLRLIEDPSDYVTEPYVQGIDILDLKRSSAKDIDTYSRVLLDAFLVALDAHCPGSTLHAKRTGEFAAAMARHLHVDERQIENSRRCGFFHDIGKIGIPDRILQKPDALSDEETEVMRRHPEIGYDLLRSFPFLQEEAEVAHMHHERWDGSGYPQGLKGEDISLLSRITAVADVFDALRFNRAYQPSMPLDVVVQTIAGAAGAQFDPNVVDTFMAIHKDLDAMFTGEDLAESVQIPV